MARRAGLFRASTQWACSATRSTSPRLKHPSSSIFSEPRRARDQPTDDWNQLRLLVASSEQERYDLLRPIVLFDQPVSMRTNETGVPERTMRRKAACFAAAAMRSLFEPEAASAPDRRGIPLGSRKANVELQAEHPPLGPFEIARICQHRFDRPVSYHTVEKILAAEPLPLQPPRRLPR